MKYSQHIARRVYVGFPGRTLSKVFSFHGLLVEGVNQFLVEMLSSQIELSAVAQMIFDLLSMLSSQIELSAVAHIIFDPLCDEWNCWRGHFDMNE